MKKLLLVVVLFFVAKNITAQTTITADFNTKHQTIDNFAASDAWVTDGIGKYWSEENKELIAKLFFSKTEGIGLSGWRFNIGAGSAVTDTNIIPNSKFWRRAECFQQEQNAAFDWTKQEGQQYFLRKASDYGVDDLIAFLNSPPVWATKNGHAQCDTSIGSTNLKDGFEDEFAEFMVTVIKHFRDEGIDINYLSPINEPGWAWNNAQQEGCRYNNEDIVRVINALYDELSANNLTSLVEIDAPEVTEYTAALDDDLYKDFTNSSSNYSGGMNGEGVGSYKNYVQLMLEDNNFAEKVGNKIALHGYFSDTWNDRLTTLRELLKENVDRYNSDAHIWMTEYTILGDATSLRPFTGGGRDLGMDLGLHTAKLIHRDFTRMNANAWQWWTAISKENYKDGLLYTDWNSNGDSETLYTSKNLWAMGNYSRFIRPGYQRIEVENPDDWENIMSSGYVSPEGDQVVLVYINSASSATEITTNIANLPKNIAKITPYVTSDAKDLEQGTDLSSLENYTIPAKSIVTLVVQLEETAPESENLALNGVATQSSLDHSGTPNRAIDNNTNGNWNQSSTTHTQTEANPWWQVDLGANEYIGKINIFNRTDCCAFRLTNFTVSIINSNNQTTFSKTFNETPDPSTIIDAEGAYGKIIRVQLNDTYPLSLAEVQVFEYEGNIASLFPNPNKTYYIDSPIFNLRLASDGVSNDPYTTSNTTTGANVEWKFVASDDGYWHIDRADGGSKPRLRTRGTDEADMNATSSTGSWTQFELSEGFSENSYFLTLPNGPADYQRLQIDNTSTVKMVANTRNRTWESFEIIEVFSSSSKTSDKKLISEIKLYPVPVTNELNVSLGNYEDYQSIQITDISGKLILINSNLSNNTETLDVSELAKGIYILNILKKDKTEETKRFIK